MTDDTYIKLALAGAMALTGLTIMGWALEGSASARETTARTVCSSRNMTVTQLWNGIDKVFFCIDRDGVVHAMDS